MSKGEIVRPAPPKKGLGFGFTSLGVMPCLRSSARTKFGFLAACSPFMVTPRLSVPSQTNTVIASGRRAGVAGLAADRVTDIAQVPWVMWRGARECAVRCPSGSPPAWAPATGRNARTCRPTAYPALQGRGRTCVTRRARRSAPVWGWDSIGGDAVDFRQAGDALFNLPQRRLPKVANARTAGSFADGHGIAARQNDLLDLFAHRHHLVDADATLVALGALLAADRLVNLEVRIGDLLGGEPFGEQGVLR